MTISKSQKILLIVIISIIIVSATVIPIVVVFVMQNKLPDDGENTPPEITKIAQLSLSGGRYNKYFTIDRENSRIFYSNEDFLFIINISDPSKPKLLHSANFHVAEMIYHNGYLYAKKLDIDPGYGYEDTNHILVFSTEANQLTQVYDLYNEGGKIYSTKEFFVDAERNVLFASGDYLTVIDLSNPEHPIITSYYRYSWLHPGSSATYQSSGIAFHPTEPVLLVSVKQHDFALFDYSNISELQQFYNEIQPSPALLRDGTNYMLVSRGSYPLFIRLTSNKENELRVINWTEARRPYVAEEFFTFNEEEPCWSLTSVDKGFTLVHDYPLVLMNVSSITNISYATPIIEPIDHYFNVRPVPILSYPYIFLASLTEQFNLEVYEVC